MTRFIHDQFSKDYLEELLKPYGTVQAPRRVNPEPKQIDVWFAPSPQATADREPLGLLGKLAATPCLLEPFRNPATEDEISDCLIKILEVRRELQRQANRNNTKLQRSTLPKLWILTPTASKALLSKFCARLDKSWLPGIYFMGDAFRTAIVVIHQLPSTPETLWLRILGKGSVQERAIQEVEALPTNNPFRLEALKLLKNLRKNLGDSPDLEKEDRRLMMRLAPLYEQDLERATQEGIQQGIQQGMQQGMQQGERLVVENLLRSRFGSLDEQLSAIIQPLIALPPEEFAPILLQLSNLSREELLARFAQQN